MKIACLSKIENVMTKVVFGNYFLVLVPYKHRDYINKFYMNT
jgi:hypothetical protein